MLEAPKVSVIIPTYMRPDSVCRAVDSVLSQTYPFFEVVVCDDNPEDSSFREATEKSMEKYADDERVIYCRHKQNMNGSAARNTGINAASGDLMAFLDDDDEMMPERLELLVSRLSELDDEYGACYSDFRKKTGYHKDQYCGEKREGDLHDDALRRALYFCPGSNLLVRASLVRELGGFDTDFVRNQDIEFVTRLSKITKFAYVDRCTLIIHHENKSRVSYDELTAIDALYLKKFKKDINALSDKERKKLMKFFALERLRYSFFYHKVGNALKNCIKNGVGVILLLRYAGYCFNRLFSGKSYGFRI